MFTQRTSKTQQQVGLTPQQKQQFHADGFLFVRNLLPNQALQPLIDELAQQVDDGTQAAVKHGILAPADTYDDEPFETRLGRVSNACADPNWIWQNYSAPRRYELLGCSHSERHPRYSMLSHLSSGRKFSRIRSLIFAPNCQTKKLLSFRGIKIWRISSPKKQAIR